MENPFLLSSLSTAGVSTGARRGGQAPFAMQLPLAYDGFDPSLAGGISGEAELQGDFLKKVFFTDMTSQRGSGGIPSHPHPYRKAATRSTLMYVH